MNPPILSVIIPAFNAERYLARCLDSVLRQTQKDFEAILINDGSSDGTSGICNEYSAKDPRIRYYQQENNGVSSARNLGLDLALGEWIIFLDADDELPPDALSQYTNYFCPDIDFIMGGYEIYNELGNNTYKIPDRIVLIMDRNAAIRLMYKPLYYKYLGYIAGKCYRTSCVRNWGIHFNRRIYYNEDRLFTTEYLCHCKRVLYFTHPVYNYYEHSGSAMQAANSSFNSKYLTDMDGYIEMKKSIELAQGSGQNLLLAKEGVFSSYRIIKTMINAQNKERLKYSILLEKKLIKGLSLRDYLKFRWGVLRDKCLNTIS